MFQRNSLRVTVSDSQSGQWVPTAEWVHSWKSKLPLQTIMRLLQVLVPQVEKICIDRYLFNTFTLDISFHRISQYLGYKLINHFFILNVWHEGFTLNLLGTWKPLLLGDRLTNLYIQDK